MAIKVEHVLVSEQQGMRSGRFSFGVSIGQRLEILARQ